MKQVRVRWLGQAQYLPVWRAMQHFTARRTAHTLDEIWLLEHPPVYTLGVRGFSHRGNKEDVEATPVAAQVSETIPLIQTDRGGLITYHGPGQLIAYVLVDLARKGISVRDLVTLLEETVITVLLQYGIHARAKAGAPGVYVKGAKIASIGLRVKKFCSYHGLSLNVNMDLTPFQWINPCGYQGLKVTQLADLGVPVKVHEVAIPLLDSLLQQLKFDAMERVAHQLPNFEESLDDQIA